jgi:hypothetical protein
LLLLSTLDQGEGNMHLLDTPAVANQQELAAHADEIRRLGKRVIADVLEIGRRLAECKRIVGHGHFGSWLQQEFGWTDRTARNFISVYELSKSKSENFSDLSLPVSGLYLLAAPSTPEEARDEIIARAESGETISSAEVKDIVENARVASAQSAPAERWRRHKERTHARRRSPEHIARQFEATIAHTYQAAQATTDVAIPQTLSEEETAKVVEELSTSRALVGELIGRLDPNVHDRDDIGASSAAELARLNVCIEELQREKHRLEIEAVGLRSEIDELKAERSPAPHVLVERALRVATLDALVGALTEKFGGTNAKAEAALDALREVLWEPETPTLPPLAKADDQGNGIGHGA